MKRVLILFRLLCFCLTIFWSNTSLAQLNHCVVLLYHQFSDAGPKSTSISPLLFEEHLKYLQTNDFQVLPLKNVIERLRMQLSLPDNCVSLTADDGYLSIYESAYPLLVKYKTPMSVFVSTEAIDKQYSSIMSWEQLREMSSLVDVYNHSVTHQHLNDKTKEVLLNEITSAQLRLKNELFQEIKFFAYPYGEFDEKVYKLIEELGYTGFGQHSGAIGTKSDFINLPRFPMASSYAEMDSFVLKINTLPMPVKNEEPKFMAISGNSKPTLRIDFSRALTKNEKYQFACHVSGQEMPNLTWLNSDSVIVQAKEPLPQGRSRYNCTMPSKEKGKYYWYSKVWLSAAN